MDTKKIETACCDCTMYIDSNLIMRLGNGLTREKSKTIFVPLPRNFPSTDSRGEGTFPSLKKWRRLCEIAFSRYCVLQLFNY